MTRLQKVIDAVLALFLIALIFVFGFKTVWPNRTELYNSVRRMSRLENYLGEDYNALDMVAARINSFEDKLNAVMWKSDELGYLNASFQYALGKKIITTGKFNMLTLPTGDMYELPAYADTSAQTGEIIALADQIETDFTFVYEHPTTYEGNLPEGGYAILDNGDVVGDEIVSALSGAGIDVIDSRDVLTGYDTADIVLRTDQHWTSRAALIMARYLAEQLGLDGEKLAIENFDSFTYPEKFMGNYGKILGTPNIAPDDITIFWPKYETYIERYTLKNSEEENVAGTFKDAVIKWETLEGEGWNTEAYSAYGLTEDFEHFHNEDAPEVTIVLFKDSYSAPIGAFLSLVARDVYTVDLRKTQEGALYYIEKYAPDHVVMAFSRKMICDREYKLFADD